MKVRAPGKIILSGEHAVLYGNPALIMAVNRHVTTTISETSRAEIIFDLVGMAQQKFFSVEGLQRLRSKIKNKYQRFKAGEIGIRQVLKKPFELAQYAVGTLADALNFSLPGGIQIHVQSSIPIGCGMGSSSATILSVMQAVSAYFNLQLSKEELYHLAQTAEHAQHGYSSGIDLHIALEGGCLYLHGPLMNKRDIQFPTKIYLVNTGKPDTSTGECVEASAVYFQSHDCRQAFAEITEKMDAALQNQAVDELYAAINENHRLLVEIGVVPKKVQDFLTQVQSKQAAGKVCGAGASRGDQAGIVLVMSHDEEEIKQLVEEYHYTLLAVQPEPQGLSIV